MGYQSIDAEFFKLYTVEVDDAARAEKSKVSKVRSYAILACICKNILPFHKLHISYDFTKPLFAPTSYSKLRF